MSNESVADISERPKEHRENRKKNRGRKVTDDQAQAIAKFVRVPPRKARLVLDEVRGRYAMDALAFLRYIPNRAAGYISKVLSSAMANAANNHSLDPERLKLVTAFVDEGPRMKRVKPRAQGRAYRILKRMSHITVVVQQVDPKPRKPRKVVRTRAQAARAARQAAEPAASVPAAVPVETPAVTSQAATSEHTDQTQVPITSEATHTAPSETNSESAATSTEAHTITQEPQAANTEDKTDEIGAPTDAA